jgi:hypothetical protein
LGAHIRLDVLHVVLSVFVVSTFSRSSLALEAKDTSSSIGPSETFLARFFVLYASVTFVDAGRFKTRLQLVRSSLLWLAKQSRAFLCLARKSLAVLCLARQSRAFL